MLNAKVFQSVVAGLWISLLQSFAHCTIVCTVWTVKDVKNVTICLFVCLLVFVEAFKSLLNAKVFQSVDANLWISLLRSFDPFVIKKKSSPFWILKFNDTSQWQRWSLFWPTWFWLHYQYTFWYCEFKDPAGNLLKWKAFDELGLIPKSIDWKKLLSCYNKIDCLAGTPIVLEDVWRLVYSVQHPVRKVTFYLPSKQSLWILLSPPPMKLQTILGYALQTWATFLKGDSNDLLSLISVINLKWRYFLIIVFVNMYHKKGSSRIAP